VVATGKTVTGWKIGDRATRCGGRIDPGRDLPNLAPIRYSAKGAGIPRDEARGVTQSILPLLPRRSCLSRGGGDLESFAGGAAHGGSACGPSVKLKLGDTAAIVGAGPIGLLAQQCVRRAGGHAGVCLGDESGRRKVAEIWGLRRCSIRDERMW